MPDGLIMRYFNRFIFVHIVFLVKQPATTPTDELHLRTTKTKKHRPEVKK
jgi:hypothetical protein